MLSSPKWKNMISEQGTDPIICAIHHAYLLERIGKDKFSLGSNFSSASGVSNHQYFIFLKIIRV